MAERLIERFKEEYPGYDEDWYLEQTIAYIERGCSSQKKYFSLQNFINPLLSMIIIMN